MGKDFGRVILSLHSELEKNRKQLEEPSTSTYNVYSNALPSIPYKFFEDLITTLEVKKQAIVNKKRNQREQPETSINEEDKENYHIICLYVTDNCLSWNKNLALTCNVI